MIKAAYAEKGIITDILSESFAENKSINFIVKQDSRKKQRIRRLMEYSFDTCYYFGAIFLSDDKKACALIVYPDQKRTTFKSILRDIKLVVSVIGLGNVKKVMNREASIEKIHPNEPLAYLWYIGVYTAFQGQGIGSALLEEVLEECKNLRRKVVLETSVMDNLPWYRKYGFRVYHELFLTYKIFFLQQTV